MTLKRRNVNTTEKREQLGMRVYPSIMERVRNVCYWEEITVVRFIEDALLAHLALFEKGGKHYPRREADLRRTAS